eukprot:g13696.t1
MGSGSSAMGSGSSAQLKQQGIDLKDLQKRFNEEKMNIEKISKQVSNDKSKVENLQKKLHEEKENIEKISEQIFNDKLDIEKMKYELKSLLHGRQEMLRQKAEKDQIAPFIEGKDIGSMEVLYWYFLSTKKDTNADAKEKYKRACWHSLLIKIMEIAVLIAVALMSFEARIGSEDEYEYDDAGDRENAINLEFGNHSKAEIKFREYEKGKKEWGVGETKMCYASNMTLPTTIDIFPENSKPFFNHLHFVLVVVFLCYVTYYLWYLKWKRSLVVFLSKAKGDKPHSFLIGCICNYQP